ncbi:MAG: hypothetical protein WD208_03790 [Dehalococcoidia bacterium]
MTIAGDGGEGLSGDGGNAIRARFNAPAHCAFDAAGSLFIADMKNHCVRMMDLVDGDIQRFAGTGTPGYEGDGGPAESALLNEPFGIAVAHNGDVYVSDRGNRAIRKVDSDSGHISTLVDSDALQAPAGLAIDNEGHLLICDPAAHRVLRLNLATCETSTFAGTGEAGQADDGDIAASARLNEPFAVAVDGDGNVFICEAAGNRVVCVEPDGLIYLFAGTGVAGASGDDGPADAATFNGPKGIACDSSGNVVIADTGNCAVRAVPADSSNIYRIAGGKRGFSGDESRATFASLADPLGCAIDADGAVYIMDAGNNRIRVVDDSGLIGHGEDYEDDEDDDAGMPARSRRDDYEDE